MMHKGTRYILLHLLCLALGMNTSSGQNQNNIWFFGSKAGIDFNPTTPTVLQTNFTLDEGMSTVCDPVTGALLFSTDGASVWTRFHTQMPNGSNLLGNSSKTTIQGTCVVPMLDSPGKYYLFSLEYQSSRFLPPQQPTPFSQGRLFYSIVDLSLNNGLGDVVASRKNILLDSLLSESMIAVPGTNCDIWLVAHAVDTSLFKAWHITRFGFNPVPVVSNAGWQVQGPGSYNQGCLAASPDGRLVAITSEGVVTGYAPDVAKGTVLCRFDGATGIVSDGVLVDTVMAYGIAFSPDNRLLYVNNWDPRERGIFQFDITSHSRPAIVASKVNTGGGTTTHYMRRFRDQIYINQQLRACLHRINSPNTPGTGCGYQDSAITLYPGTGTRYTLPNDVVYPFPKDTLHIRTDTFLCAVPQQLALRVAAGYDSYLWDDGSLTNTRVVTRPGTYWVISGDYCHSRVDTFVVTQRDSLFFSTDTILCAGRQTLDLHAPAGYRDRQWDDLSTDSIRVINTPGNYWVISRDACVPRIDSFRVAQLDFSGFGLGPDTIICGDTPLLLSAGVSGVDYLWQDGSADSIFQVRETGVYWVNAGMDNCRQSDTIRVSFVDLPGSYLPEDTTICREDRLTLDIRIPASATAAWSDGTAGTHFRAPDSGLYQVTVSLSACSVTDTIRLAYEVCDCHFAVPSAFTPNGDGKNDIFRIIMEPSCEVQNYSCYILDRWGQLIYNGNDPLKGWDGSYSGNPAEIGTYMFFINFEGGDRGKAYSLKGDLTLIR